MQNYIFRETTCTLAKQFVAHVFKSKCDEEVGLPFICFSATQSKTLNVRFQGNYENYWMTGQCETT